MRSFGLGLLAFVVCVGALPVQAQEVKHTQYRIEATLDDQTHILSGVEQVVFPNTGQTPLEALFFILSPNFEREPNPKLDPVLVDAGYGRGFDAAWLQVFAVRDEAGDDLAWSYETSPNAFQNYSLENTLLRVTLPQPLAPGQSTTLTIDFETKFPNSLNADQSYHDETYHWRFAWNPVAVPADELIDGQYFSDQRDYYPWRYPAALYDLTLTVPQGLTVAAGTNVQEVVSTSDDAGTKTLHLASDVPIRSVALSMGHTLRRYTLAGTTIPISVYYLPGEEAAARQLATYAVEVLAAYAARWGAYAYEQLTIVSSWADGYFGMAADGLIILGNSAFSEKDLTVAGMADRVLEYLLAHEIAHQWWGMGVGVDFNAENYLSEAFAEYLSITYFEDKYQADGPNLIQLEREGLLESAVASQFGYLNLRQHFGELAYLRTFRDRFDEALVKPQKRVEYVNNTAARVYNKGYLVLRALAGLIGPQTLDQVLLQAYQRYNHRFLDSATFQAVAEEVSGQDLNAFFEDWVYGDAFVDFAIESVNTQAHEDGEYLTEVTVSRHGNGRLPVEVVVVTEDDEKVGQTWDPERDEPTLTFVTPAPPKEVQLDPGSWTPDTARINNYFPTRLRIIPDGKADVPLDAYLLRFDPFKRTLEGGFVLDYRWLVADGLLAFVFNQGRGNTIDGALFVGDEVLAEFGWNLTQFLHPDLGVQGKYWEPAHQLRLSLSRRLDLDARPVNYAGLSYRYSRLLTSRQIYQISAVADPFSFLRVAGAAAVQTLLRPHTTLDVQAQVGYSVGELPSFLRFSLAELNAYFEQQGDKRIKRSFPGRYKGLVQVGVDFPIRSDMAYSVAGLALVRQVQGRAYLTAGQTTDDLAAFSLSQAKLEIGFEATASGQMFGGLLPFSVMGGIAMALSERSEENAYVIEPYVRLSIPFL